MISTATSSAYRVWAASIAAASPLNRADSILKAALVSAGTNVLALIDAEIAVKSAILDAPDPTGKGMALISSLLALSAAATDQGDLVALRGIAGRQLFNLQQA